MESPHRWLILAGISFLAALTGTIFMFAFVWPHGLARAWLLAGLALTALFLLRAGIDWKRAMEAEIARLEAEGSATAPMSPPAAPETHASMP
jgi:hypothetical protein